MITWATLPVVVEPYQLLVVPGMIHAFVFFESEIPDFIARLYDVIGLFLAKGEVPDA